VVGSRSTGRLIMVGIAVVMFFIWFHSILQPIDRKTKKAEGCRPAERQPMDSTSVGKTAGQYVGHGVNSLKRWRIARLRGAAERQCVGTTMPFEQPAPDLAKIILAGAGGAARYPAARWPAEVQGGSPSCSNNSPARAGRPRSLRVDCCRFGRRRCGVEAAPSNSPSTSFTTSEDVPWPADLWTVDSLVAVSATWRVSAVPDSRLSAVLVLLAPGLDGPGCSSPGGRWASRTIAARSAFPEAARPDESPRRRPARPRGGRSRPRVSPRIGELTHLNTIVSRSYIVPTSPRSRRRSNSRQTSEVDRAVDADRPVDRARTYRTEHGERRRSTGLCTSSSSTTRPWGRPPTCSWSCWCRAAAVGAG
jgi:hypothetical protein